MRYIEGISRQQLILFPEKLDDMMSDDNPVRFIDEFINQLDLHRLGFTNTGYYLAPGAPAYSAEALLKLYVFGYFKKIRSSRKLMEMARTNIEAMWLLERLMPDFRTIADFRKNNIDAIKKVFKAFVRMCAELGIYSKEVGVQDGSKFKANNSKDNNVTESKLKKKLEIAEEKICKYLEEMDKLDKEESDSQKYTKEELEKKMQMLSDRKDYYNDLLDQMKEEGVTQISFTDPDSRLMKTANGGFEVSYNVQIVADPVSHMVGAVEVTNNCNDIGLLSSVTEDLKDTLEVPVMEVVADKGYEQKEDMLECLMNGTIPHVPSKADGDSYELELDYKEAEITEELLASKNSDDIKTCLEAGALPDVYKDKGIEISVHEKDVTSSFTLTEDGAAVICPNGSTLNKAPTINSRGKTRFTNRSACRDCSDKCTTSKFKQVDMNEGQTVLHLKRRHKPDNKIVKKVKIKLTPDMEKISNRKTVVEHPFGTVKHWNDGAHALLTGKRKVGADLSLAFLGYNIKRAINMVGVQELIERMRELIGDISCYFGYFAKSIEKSVSKSIYSSSAA